MAYYIYMYNTMALSPYISAIHKRNRAVKMSSACAIDHEKKITAKVPCCDNTFQVKMLIIGNSSVGKSSFLQRYANDTFKTTFVSTAGLDFSTKMIFKEGNMIKQSIFDTAGQEHYRTIRQQYYKGTMGFILMYDVTNEESFNAVREWCTQIQAHSSGNVHVILVGNKCDLEHERVVTHGQGKQLANELGMEFFESSAKKDINVRTTIEILADTIVDKMTRGVSSNSILVKKLISTVHG